MKQYLTMDLGKGWLRWAVTSEDLCIKEKGKFIVDSVDDPDAVFGPIKSICRKWKDQVEGLCLTMPGVIDTENGIAYSGGVYTWARNLKLGEQLKKMTGLNAIIINDAKAGTYAEMGYGSLKNVKSGVMLMVLGTGIGGAIVSHGHIYEGSHFAAGEFSYMFGDYMDRENGKDMFALSMSINALTKLVKEVTGNPKINVMKIMAGLNMHDEKVIEGVRIYCDRLARYIYNIQCVVDAERFVIGGNITEDPTFMRMIYDSVQKCFANAPYQNIFVPDIRSTAFNDESRNFGAVWKYCELKKEGKI